MKKTKNKKNICVSVTQQQDEQLKPQLQTQAKRLLQLTRDGVSLKPLEYWI